MKSLLILNGTLVNEGTTTTSDILISGQRLNCRLVILLVLENTRLECVGFVQPRHGKTCMKKIPVPGRLLQGFTIALPAKDRAIKVDD